jgi:uncharacterized membrane protein YphA (DoxX/SURF4 family)
MMPAAKALAVALAVFECILGAALVTGVWRKPVAVITTVVIGLFSILTFVMAVTKSEMDCGCFGEVIHLTSWQTYFKNLILLALALVAFVPYRNLGSNKRRKFVSFSIVTVSVIAFAVYSLTTLPMWDFTSFAPGSELLSAGSPSQSDASDSDDFVATFIYEKDGQKLSISIAYYAARSLDTLAILIQEQLKAVGIDSTLRVEEDPDATYIANADFDLALYCMIADKSGDPLYFIDSTLADGAYYNVGGFESAECQSMIEQLRIETDTAKRAELANKIVQIAIDDNAFGYVGLFNNTTVLRKGVSGFAEYVPFDFYGVDAETDING